MNDDTITEIKLGVQRIEIMLDGVISRQNRKDSEDEKRDEKIHEIQRKMWVFGGGLAVLATAWDSIKHKLFN